MSLHNGSLWADSPEKAVNMALKSQPTNSPWRVQLLRGCSASSHVREGPPSVIAAMVCSVERKETELDVENGKTSHSKYICVSLGSGTRCCGASLQFSSSHLLPSVAIGDGHAEVLARRGCIAFFLDSLEHFLADKDNPDAFEHLFFEWKRPNSTCKGEGSDSLSWRWRPGVRLHLLVTQWPCGFLAKLCASETGSRLLLRNPLKLDLSTCVHSTTDQEDHAGASTEVFGHRLAQHRSAVDLMESLGGRVKPGKGDPNLHMSCSDKIWRWSVQGVLGSRREALLPPLLLSSLHVAGENCNCGADAAQQVHASRREYILRTSHGGVLPLGPLQIFAFSLPDIFDEVKCNKDASSAEKENTDYGCSRATWIGYSSVSKRMKASYLVVNGSVGVFKRPREEVDRLSKSTQNRGEDSFSWLDNAGRPLHSLALNTRTGMPHGITPAVLRHRYPSLASENAEKSLSLNVVDHPLRKVQGRDFLLSRMWMAFKVYEVLEKYTASENMKKKYSLSAVGDQKLAVAEEIEPTHVFSQLIRQKCCVIAGVEFEQTTPTRCLKCPLIWTYKPRLGEKSIAE